MGHLGLADLRLDGGKQDLVAEDLDRTGGRSGTAADQADEEEHADQQAAPAHVIDAGKPRAGHDRGDVEQRLAEGLFGMVGEDGGQDEGGADRQPHDDPDEPAHLFVPKEWLRGAVQDLDIAHEGQRREDHVDRGGIFQRPLKGPEGGVVIGETAGRERGERVHRRVKGIHAHDQIGEHAGDGQADIDDRDLRGDGAGAGEDLAHRLEGFGFEDLHPAHAQFGQKHHGHDDDADPAQPLQDSAPEQKPLGQVIQSDKDGRACRGHARHRLEKGIDEARLGRAQHEGQGAEHRQDQPDAAGQDEGLLQGQTLAGAAATGQGHQRAAEKGQDRAFGKDGPMAPTLGQIHRKRRNHGQAKRRDQKADHISDGSQIQHGGKAWPQGAALSSVTQPCRTIRSLRRQM